MSLRSIVMFATPENTKSVFRWSRLFFRPKELRVFFQKSSKRQQWKVRENLSRRHINWENLRQCHFLTLRRWVYYKISHIFTEIENRHTTFKNTFFFIYKRYIFQKYIVVSTFYWYGSLNLNISTYSRDFYYVGRTKKKTKMTLIWPFNHWKNGLNGNKQM